MKTNRLIASILSFLLSVQAFTQMFITDADMPVNGYAAKVAGTDFEYHSCIPNLRESLLIRAIDGKDFLEWVTDPVPAAKEKTDAAIIWVAGMGGSPGMARMDLTTDQGHHFTFFLDGRPAWRIDAADGTSLSFISIMTDQFGDYHGYLVLRIPAQKIIPGKALKIKVTGGNNNLSSWYMTFRKAVKTDVSFHAFPALIRQDNKLLHYVEAAVFYFGMPADAVIYANNREVARTRLAFGYNSVNIGLPEVSKPAKVNIRFVSANFSSSSVVTLLPVRKWTVDLIQHTHTDIGYTRSQTEILAEHLRYIDYALDYCDATDNYPENAKFRWTCEAAWPVDEYLKTRPAAQVNRLLKRIREGRIEVTGMYFNFDEIPDEQILAASMQAVGRIKGKGVPVNLAMQNDVNGIGWCFGDYFTGLGIKYLNMGTHGHRALICFDKPTMFWWESPSGNRILTFRAEHYMTGNTVFEMQNGDIVKFRNNLLSYLDGLAAKGYPYNEIAIQHSGYLTDNSPPSTIASELIKQWNEMFEWPKLTTSTAGTFFSNMEKDHGSEFPVIRGAWPDWWTDGFGASARETATTRKAAAALLGNMAGLSMAAIAGAGIPEKSIEQTGLANEALLFYTEHTLGYSESVREPLSLQTMEQRALKESYAWEANRRTASVGEEAMGILQSLVTTEKEPTLTVFNSLNFERSAPATLYIDHQIVPGGSVPGVFDKEGKRCPVQAISSRSDGTYWMIWFNDIPAFGFRKYTVKPVREDKISMNDQTAKILENRWYRIVPDIQKGTIRSLFDKTLNLELTDQSTAGLGEFIYEQLGNRSQMEQKKFNSYKRLPLDTIWFDSMTYGDVYNSIRFYGETATAEAPRGFSIEYKLYNTGKRIEIACSIVKKDIISPESFYIGFPFALSNGKHFTEVAGGVIKTGTDQIKGSSNDWYTVQTFTAIRNNSAQIVIGCTEMPLMQFGAINTGRYTAGAEPQGTHLYSWPMNNYWVTNFNADQRGGQTWSYYLTTTEDVSNGFSTRFGWGCRVPLLTRIMPGGGNGGGKAEGSFIEGWPSNAIMISAAPLDKGESVLIHLRETDGKNASISLKNGLTGKELQIKETDVTGLEIKAGENRLRPYESKFFVVKNNSN